MAGQPFHWTAYTFLLIEERRHAEGLVGDLSRVLEKGLMAIAFHDPAQLRSHEREARSRLTRGPDTVSAQALIAFALAQQDLVRKERAAELAQVS